MKKLLLALLFATLAGCEYKVPLAAEPGIEIDRALLGVWQHTEADGTERRLLVLPEDEHHYLVSYPAGSEDAMFAQAGLARIGGKLLVQLKWMGTAKAELLGKDDAAYQFGSFEREGSRLTFRLLSTEVVPKSIDSTPGLIESIEKNLDNPALFREETVFTSVRQSKS